MKRAPLERDTGPLVVHIFELRAVFALPLLPNRQRRWCRVSDLVFLMGMYLLVVTFKGPSPSARVSHQLVRDNVCL